MWMSCSSFFQTIFHLYCPVNYGRKVDPNGDYIRKYLPVLKNFPTQFIHEPWKAPLVLQQKANCIIGKHYPIPIIDYQAAAKINMDKMRQVLTSLTSSPSRHSKTHTNGHKRPSTTSYHSSSSPSKSSKLVMIKQNITSTSAITTTIHSHHHNQNKHHNRNISHHQQQQP